MVLPGLDSAFGSVSTMAVRRDSLEIDVVFAEGLLEVVRAFVVKDVEGRCVAVVLEFGV